jgi:peptide deformylase
MEINTDKTILRQVSKKTTQAEVASLDLVRKLRDANKTAWTNGAGLAAIQIGIPLRFAWYIFQSKERVLFNPKILRAWGEDTQKEGCLSIPNKWIEVKRAYTIEFVSNGKKKRTSGFEARLIQHEIDHMDGKLITDLSGSNKEG